MKKVLIVSDSFKNITGLSYVALNFAKYFTQRGFEVSYCNIVGENCTITDLYDKGHFFYENLFEINIHNCQVKLENSFLLFNNLLEKIKPDIIFSVHDLWQLENIAFSNQRDTYTWIAYCPIESDYYSTYIVHPTYFDKSFRKPLTDICQNIDYVIAYNIIGLEQLKKLGANCIGYLPNGLDDYYILDEEIDRKKIFKGILKDDDFVFMSVGNNFQRKGLDYVVEAFSSFLSYIDNEQKNKYKLYLHGFLETIDAGTDLKSMIYHLNLSNNIVMSQGTQISKRELYKRYRCCDCYIGLPLAEGFGYGFAEAQLNNIPVIYHNVGGISQYFNRSIQVGSVAEFRPNNYYCKWKIPDIEETVEYMLRITENNNYINKDNLKITQNNTKEMKWESLFHSLDNIIDFQQLNTNNIFHTLNIRRIV